MNNEINLNRINLIIQNLAKNNGVTLEDSDGDVFDWSVNWVEGLDESFMKDIHSLHESLDLYEKAIARGDMLAAKAGLLEAGVFAHNLTSFFDAIKDDLKRVIADERFDWPKFPDDYQVPSIYK